MLLLSKQNLRQHHQSQTDTIYLKHKSTTPKEIERDRDRDAFAIIWYNRKSIQTHKYNLMPK